MSVQRLFGNRMKTGETTVTLDATGGGAETVDISGAGFVGPPAVLVIPDRADEAAGATYAASSITSSAFSITVAASAIVSADVAVKWVAVEKD